MRAHPKRPLLSCDQGTVPSVPIGGTCIASETPSTAGLSQYCNNNGTPGTPYWDVSYSPSATVSINAGNNTLQIENDLKCSPILVVTKKFDDATGGPYPFPSQTFGIQVTCAGASTTTLSFQTPGTTASLPSSTSSSSSLSTGLTVGALCQTTENPNPPPIPLIAYKSCRTGDGGGVPYWTVTYSLGANFNLAAGINTLLIDNKLQCGPPTADHPQWRARCMSGAYWRSRHSHMASAHLFAANDDQCSRRRD